MAARKLAAAAELARRRPAPGSGPRGPGRMPAACDEFTGDELAHTLAESRRYAGAMVTLAVALQTRLPGTKAALRDGIIPRHKAQTGPGGPGGGPGPAGPDHPAAGPAAGAAPGGFAGKVTLTVPLGTLQDQAGRPGEIPGTGPIDPALARDLAAAAARNPRTTWCVTVTETAKGMPSGTAAPDLSLRATANEPGRRRRTDPIRPAVPAAPRAPGSPSPSPARKGRPAATAPGSCIPQEAGRTSWSPSTRSRPGTATTGSRPGATIPGSSCGTWPRSGTRPAPDRSAGGPLPKPASSTTRPTKRAGAHACVMGVHRANDNDTGCLGIARR